METEENIVEKHRNCLERQDKAAFLFQKAVASGGQGGVQTVVSCIGRSHTWPLAFRPPGRTRDSSVTAGSDSGCARSQRCDLGEIF